MEYKYFFEANNLDILVMGLFWFSFGCWENNYNKIADISAGGENPLFVLIL